MGIKGKKVRNGRELSSSLLNIGIEFEGDLDKVLQKLTLDGFRELLRRTPVRTGFLKSKWAVQKTSPPTTLVKNPGGSFPEPKYPNLQIEWGDHVRLFNNTEYAWHIEHGTQNMRAQPMVEPTYLYLDNIAKRLLDYLSKQKKP